MNMIVASVVITMLCALQWAVKIKYGFWTDRSAELVTTGTIVSWALTILVIRKEIKKYE